MTNPPPPPPGYDAERTRTRTQDADRRPRGRLSNGLMAFVLVDVVLVLAVVVVAVITFSGSDGRPSQPTGPAASATGTQAPGSPAPAEQTPEAPTPGDEPGSPPVPEPVTFASPSRNIGCTIDEAGVRCGIASLAKEPEAVEGCDGTVGFVWDVTAAGVDTPCTPTDQKPAKAPTSVNVLGYGQRATGFGFTCTSAEAGVTCVHDESGRGFLLARAGGRAL